MTDAHDIIVIGAGAGGMTAALVAACEGLDVLLLEKTGLVGGTTAISGGMVWAPNSAEARGTGDSRERAETYLDETVPTEAGRELRRAFLAHAPAAVAYLRHHSAVRLTRVPTYPDYYPEAEGATTNGRVLEPEPFDGRELGDAFALLRPPLEEFTLFGGMMVARADLPHFRNVFRSPKSLARVAHLVCRYLLQRLRYPRGVDLVLGNALAGRLLKSLRDRAVPVRVNADIVRLHRDGDRIAGVIVRQDGEEKLIAARRGVVLAAGGFAHDTTLRRQLYPGQAQEVSVVTQGATGDGLRLGAEAGGHIGDSAFGAGFWTPASHYRRADGRHVIFPHTVTDRGKPGLIAVGADGRRFTNEAVSYHEFVRAMLIAENTDKAVPARLICDRRFLWKYGLGAIRPMTRNLHPFIAAGYLSEAPSIAALANRLGIDPANLEATVELHNRDARDGVDTQFGRGSNVYQRHFGDPQVTPNPCLAPIEKPPFYSAAVYPADLGTSAGLESDANARVLDREGRPIPGLYACGADMNSIMQGAYPGPGITIGPALVFGYLAARHAAGANRADLPPTTTGEEGQ